MHIDVFLRPGHAILGAMLLFPGLFPLPAIAGATLEKIRDTQAITIAHRETTAPFSYLDGKSMNMPMGYLLRDSILYPTDKIGD